MEFRDLKRQYNTLKDKIDVAIAGVLNESNYISGKQVAELEDKLAAYVGVKHCITCGNGTDAITIALMAWNVGDGDAVFVPDFTFFSSGECPAGVGATPIFVDVKKQTYNIDPIKLEQAIKEVIAEGILKAKAVIAVDLFGQPAEYDKVRKICKKYNLFLLEDGAQGFGGSIKGKMACSFGDISTTSFFPAKPLGCYGDGGAIFTDNDEWAQRMRSYCIHGKNGNDKYDNIYIGMNSRLDTIQAAILLEKLKAFKEYEIENVNQVARWYGEELKNSTLTIPVILPDYRSSWAQYTVLLPENTNRVEFQNELKNNNIPSNVYYRKPMHQQGAFRGTRSSEKMDCSVTEEICDRVISLPIGPYVSQDEVRFVAEIINALLSNK